MLWTRKCAHTHHRIYWKLGTVFPIIHNWDKQISVVSKPYHLLYFATEMHTDKNTSTQYSLVSGYILSLSPWIPQGTENRGKLYTLKRPHYNGRGSTCSLIQCTFKKGPPPCVWGCAPTWQLDSLLHS
jgi:hypothetical protein